ncbi:phage holin family protein, partial [Megasphaera stantonii]|uniref:phage holin family protein n=1 Tax=Megasphaera stantonii TaxID=2144175 RepID=UPI0018E551D4
MMTALLGWLRSLIPVQTEIERGAVASAAGALNTHFTGWRDIHDALVVLMAIDYLTGIAAAYINPNMKPNCKQGFSGFCKKMVILCIIVFVHELVR